jgi:serine/threonine protein phosphatase PrpC
MAIHDTNGANGLTVENKVLEIRRTNSSSTADTDKLNFTFNTTLGYKTRIGEDTDYTSADNKTVDIRRDSNTTLGNRFQNGNIRGGQVKSFKNLKRPESKLEGSADTTTLILSADGQLIEVNSGTMRAVRNSNGLFTPVTTTTHNVNRTDAASAATAANGDKAPGFNEFNDTVKYYARVNAAATTTTFSLSLSTAK